MNLTNESTVVTKRDVATHLDHKLTFRYEIADAQPRPVSVSVEIAKIAPENTGNGPVSYTGFSNLTVSNASVSGNYPPSTPNELIVAVKEKCLELINGEGE